MKKQQQRADDLDDDYLLEPITDDVLGRDDDTAAETPVRASTKRSAKQADDEDAGDDRSHHQQSKQNKAQAKGKGAQSAAEQSRKKPRVDDGEQLEDAADDQTDDDDDDDDEQRLATPKPADGHSYTPEELLALKRARRKRQNLKQKAKLKMRDASKDAMLQNESKSQAAVFMSELGNAYQNKLSGLELEEAQVDSTHFVDYESFKEPHTLANMCSFVKHIVPHWGAFFAVSEKQKAKVPFGAPRALILVPSALRAAEVIRSLEELGKLCKIGKLFAKHFKVDEQIEYLTKNHMRLAVGTPNRVSKLVEQGSLNFSQLEYVIVDCERNSKNQSIFQLDGVNKDLFDFIRSDCLSRVKKGRVKLALF